MCVQNNRPVNIAWSYLTFQTDSVQALYNMLRTLRRCISVISVLGLISVVFWLHRREQEPLLVTTTEMEEEESDWPQYKEEKLWDEFDPNEVKTDREDEER